MLCESYCMCEYREARVAHLLRQTDSVKSFSQSGLLGLSVGRDVLRFSQRETFTVRLSLHDSTSSVDTKSFL